MKANPTGKRRYRVLHRLFRRDVLVLQIEVRGYVPYNHIGGDFETWWVDAPPELLLEEE